METFSSGWLTKSPKNKKGLFSMFSSRQKWRRRYFVLLCQTSTSRRSSSCPHVDFSYYEDEKSETKKGTIDLENFEEIVENVESCYYKHLFLLRTNKRTYYFAADSADQLTSWVDKLRSCLNLYEDNLFCSYNFAIETPEADQMSIKAGKLASDYRERSFSSGNRPCSKEDESSSDEKIATVNPKNSSSQEKSKTIWYNAGKQDEHNLIDEKAGYNTQNGKLEYGSEEIENNIDIVERFMTDFSCRRNGDETKNDDRSASLFEFKSTGNNDFLRITKGSRRYRRRKNMTQSSPD